VIRLLTGLPRPNGVGEYVAQLAEVGVPSEIYYRRPMTAREFDATEGRPDRLGTEFAQLVAWRRFPREVVARTHVTWEGHGPVFGGRTRLLTIHHVLPEHVPWERWPDGRGLRRSLVFAAARRGQRRAARLGVRVIVPSGAVRDAFVREIGADPARVEVVPHRIDLDVFGPLDRREARERLGWPTTGPVLLHVGVDDGRKNVPGLLAIHRAFRSRHPEARLAQLGHSPAVERQIALGPDPGVFYRPAVPRSELPVWYSAASVLVLPTFLEGFGRAALEAMACGTPVVTSALPVFEEELGPQYRGVPPEATGRWVEAIEAVLSDPPTASALRSQVAERFGRAPFDARYRALYRELDAG
jgi:glycosyltransferase involved in cell wall biosynthesis